MPRLAIPQDLASIDAAWLSAALGVTVVAVTPGGETGGIAITSRVMRLRLVTEPVAAAPSAVVVKIANPAWTDGAAMYRREVQFYRDFAADRDFPAPRCWFADYDESSGAFVLVLEDVGDVEPGHRLDGLTDDEADAVIDGLADLHRAWWQRDELTALPIRGHDPDRIARAAAAVSARLAALDAAGTYPLDDAVRAVLPAVQARYADGMRALSRKPQTLIHADLHVENFFLAAGPAGMRLIAIDWQNASYGHCAFDVSHVLTSMKPHLVANHRERLLARYHARLGAPRYRLESLREDVAASVRHQFVGSLNWFATFEAETVRDADMLRAHWTRLCAALIATD